MKHLECNLERSEASQRCPTLLQNWNRAVLVMSCNKYLVFKGITACVDML